jgi:SnoaL-like domain
MTARQISLDDRLAIHDLFGWYCFYIDHGEASAWADLFVEDAEFSGLLAEPFRGREQLRGLATHSFERAAGKARHQITNIVLEAGETPQEVTMRAYGLITDWSGGGRPLFFADYAIRLVKTHGQWRVQHLQVEGLPGPIDALPMDRAHKLEIERACSASVVRWIHAANSRDLTLQSGIFAQQGVWRRNQEPQLSGRAAISAFLRSQPPPQHILLLNGAAIINVVDETHAEGVSQTVLLAAHGAMDPTSGEPPLPRVVTDRDTFVEEQGQWVIARRVSSDLARSG